MAKLIINGQAFVGDSVRVSARNVYVDGDLVGSVDANQKEIDIRVTEGVLKELHAGGSVTCTEIQGSADAGGSISVSGNVGGNVDAGGSANIDGNVGGDVDTGGSARVGGSVSGSIDAGGSVRVGG